jgi:hypothetical protein
VSSKVTKIGTFGNANANNSQDWVPVIDLTESTDFFKGVFNSDNNSCTLKSSLQLEVVTSIAGFQYSP